MRATLVLCVLLAACSREKSESDTGPCLSVPVDGDGDGYGSEDITVAVCGDDIDALSTDDLLPATDCDDGDPAVHPGAEDATDGVDNDCDGVVDPGPDADLDGDGYSEVGRDCDDSSSAISPAAEEIPYDGIDQDCSGADLTDVDGDGHDATSAAGDDPDDADASIYPESSAYDDDGDGYSDDAGDCDDGDLAVHPGATEDCATDADDDCDGSKDAVYAWWYPDGDGDGHGDPDSGVYACSTPAGYGDDDTDCDDSSAAISPDGTEICDELDHDEDCDGLADDRDSEGAIGMSAWYPDADGDGYGSPSDPDTVVECDEPVGPYASVSGDCDDGDPNTYPDAPEVCDGHFNDCSTSSAWTDSLEYGLVTFIPAGGVGTDLSGALSASAGTVTPYTIDEDGALNFCADPTAPEIWYVSLTVDPRLTATIKGIYGSNSVTLSGDTTDRVIDASYDTLEVESLTLRDGYASVGSGIYASGSTLSLTDVVLTDDLTESGTYSASVVLEETSAILDDVKVSGNDAGYGLICENGTLIGSDLSISNNYIGGIYLHLTTGEISDSTLSDNDNAGLTISNSEQAVLLDGVDITGNGFGIYANYAGTLELKDTQIFLNSPGYGTSGAGIYVAYNGTLSMEGSQISNNTASYSGGGVFFGSYSGGTTTLSMDATSSISDNIATYGGGVHLLNSSSISCEGGEISDNTASYGSDAYLAGGTIVSNGCDWSGNSIFDEPTDTTYDPADLPDPFTCDPAGCAGP